MNKTSLIVAVVFLTAGILIGMALIGSGGAASSNANALFCQDALARRA